MSYLRICFLALSATSVVGSDDCRDDADVQSVNLLQKGMNIEKSGSTLALETTKELFKTFQICGQCNTFERFGEAHDGGYAMCADDLRSGSITAAYSIGVFTYDGWAQDVSDKLGLPINQFDCTVENGTSCKSCQFFKQCIVGSNGTNIFIDGNGSNAITDGVTLNQALEETGHGNAKDGSLLMKMDIEGSEWDIFAQESPEALRKFGQLIVEFHSIRNTHYHPKYLSAMQRILASGFRVAHLHGNNCCPMFKAGDAFFPDIAEVTFVRGDERPDGCLDHQEYLKLDATNQPEKQELPFAHMS